MIKLCAIFLASEILAYFIFSCLNARFFPADKKEVIDPEKNYFSRERFWAELTNLNIENTKGFFERLMLVSGMVCDYSHVIVFFGALKMGTRFDNTKDCKASTNYFVLGNVVSVIIVLLVVKLNSIETFLKCLN